MEAFLAVVLGFVSAGLLWYAWREIRTARPGQEPPGRLQDRIRPRHEEEGEEGPSEETLSDFEPARSEPADPAPAGSGRPEAAPTGPGAPEPSGAEPVDRGGGSGDENEEPVEQEPPGRPPDTGHASAGPAREERSYDYELYSLQGDVGQGFRVRRTSDGEVIPWRSLPVKEGLLAFQVDAVDEHLDVAQLADFSAGEPVRLVPASGPAGSQPPESDAPAASRIAVCDVADEYRVGYVPEEKADLVARLIEADPGYRGMVLWETSREGQVVGLRVLLTASDASIRFPGRSTERDSASPGSRESGR